MKLVKAASKGIVTDLGLGSHVYNITEEGCVVEDSVASKLNEIFGHHVIISDVAVDVQEEAAAPVAEVGQVPAEKIEEAAVSASEVEPVSTEVAPVEVTPEVTTASLEDQGPATAAEQV